MPTVNRKVITEKIQKATEISGELKRQTKVDVDAALEVADRLDGRKSSVLATVIGATAGGSLGVMLNGFAIAGWSISGLLTGPAGMLVGGALALLSWRGRKQWQQEKQNDIRKSKFEAISKEIEAVKLEFESLPAGTPQKVRLNYEDHWLRLLRERKKSERPLFEYGAIEE